MKIFKKNIMYWIIGIILIIAILATIFVKVSSMDTWLLFWGSLAWGIATLIAVVYSVKNNWEQQSDILKREIKVQLFDKRYSVFNSLVKAQRFINRQDINLIVMSGTMSFQEMQRNLNDLNDDIKDKTALSQTIFDENIHNKMLVLAGYYQELFVNFLKLPFEGFKAFAMETLSKEQINIMLDKIYRGDYNFEITPDLKATLAEWSAIAEKFNKYCDECGLMDDFDKYLKINNMDEFGN